MDNIPNVEKKINEIYDKAKYLDKYGGSYYGTIFLLIIFFCVIGYLLVQINLEPIKKDFPKNKFLYSDRTKKAFVSSKKCHSKLVTS